MDRDELRSAYLDGELSVTEALAYEKSLTEQECAGLIAERRFEASLGETIRSDIRCPDPLWHRVKARIRDEHRVRFMGVGWRWGAIGAAATALVLISIIVPEALRGQTAFLEPVASLEALRQDADVPADLNAVAHFLASHKMALTLRMTPTIRETDSHTHQVTFLGARERKVGSEKVVQLMYNCCGTPAVVLLSHQNTEVADRILRASREQRIQASRRVGSYVVGLVSKHHAPVLLRLVGQT